MLKERVITGLSGWTMVAILVAGPVAGIVGVTRAAALNGGEPPPVAIALFILLMVVDLIGWRGLTIVHPNTARVIQLFGRYQGTIKKAGLRWINPFTTRRFVSLRIRNFESGKLKVNDNIGNPIEIAAIVVWRVVETAEAMFEVNDYEHFVHVQSESACAPCRPSFPTTRT